MSAGDNSVPVSTDELTQYLMDEIRRAIDDYAARPVGNERTLAVGRALALFNLADRFQMAAQVREQLRQLTGADVYLVFSDAMRDIYGTPPRT